MLVHIPYSIFIPQISPVVMTFLFFLYFCPSHKLISAIPNWLPHSLMLFLIFLTLYVFDLIQFAFCTCSCSSLFYLFIFGFVLIFPFVFLVHVWCLTFFFNSQYYTSWSFIISFLIFMLHLNHLPLLLHFISLIIKCKELIWLMEFSFYCFSWLLINNISTWGGP